MTSANCRQAGCIVLGLLWTSIAARPAPAADVPRAAPAAETLHVAQTYNHKPFDYQLRETAVREDYRLLRLTYPSPVATAIAANNTIPADYYLPKGAVAGAVKRPAVICLHILNGNFELESMTCAYLAKRGIPALMFKLPYYGERAGPEGRKTLAKHPELFAAALAQGLEDTRRTIDLLAARPEVDPQHIDVVGISMGGILAATAAGVDERLYRTALILAGGDLPQMIAHAREARELREMLAGLPPAERAAADAALARVDPLQYAGRLRPRAEHGQVLMINAAADEVIPRSCTEQLAAALGMKDGVTWLDGLGHYTAIASMPKVLRTTADFFALDLPPGAEPPLHTMPVRPMPALNVVRLLQQAELMITGQPPAGRCHFVQLEAAATLPHDKKIKASGQLIHGPGYQFRIECKVDGVAAVALGQGEYPWLVGGGKKVFCGRLPAGTKAGDPLPLADPKQTLKLKMVSGALAALWMAPEVLDQWVGITQKTTANGHNVLQFVGKGKHAGTATLELDDGSAPELVQFDIGGVQGQVRVHGWQINAPANDAMFEPPPGLPQQDVDAADLYRMWSALLNFALENAE